MFIVSQPPAFPFTDANTWRVKTAHNLALIIDAADYFLVLRKVFLEAERELLLIGWDFDFELDMLPGESDEDGNAPDGFPNKLGPFLEAVVEREPQLHVHILKWNGAFLVTPGRILPTLAMYFFGSERIHFAMDSHHPFGACHHQKIIVADDTLAFCGGIDVTEGRWDTPEHLPDDPKRLDKDGNPCGPWHDVTTALSGPAASALAELCRSRWLRATGDVLDYDTESVDVPWPDDLRVNAHDVEVAIARTEPPFGGEPLINEVEMLFLDAIASARNTIYIESQYLTTQSICEALADRLREPQPPEIVIINPQNALKAIEDQAMHVLRGRVIRQLQEMDHADRFRIFAPVMSTGEQIYVHAKVTIVDDVFLTIGSSNLDDRSMGFDTECNVAIQQPASLISGFRTRLLSEHLGVSPEVFEAAFMKTGSLIKAIDRLNDPDGRGLRPIVALSERYVGKWLADTRILDPRYLPGEHTDTGRGLRPRHIVGAIGMACVVAFIWKRCYNKK